MWFGLHEHHVYEKNNLDLHSVSVYFSFLAYCFLQVLIKSQRANSRILQNNLQRVRVYSNCGQLAYMIFARSISNYSASTFHLMDHAFVVNILN